MMIKNFVESYRNPIQAAAEVFRKLYELAHNDPAYMHASLHNAQDGATNPLTT